MRDALHGPDDATVRRHAAKKVFAAKTAAQLLRRYQKIRQKKRRKLRLAQLETVVNEQLERRFPPQEEVEEREEVKKEPVRVLQGGFHPDLVFMAPSLSELQRREAIRRICGMNLADAEPWRRPLSYSNY